MPYKKHLCAYPGCPTLINHGFRHCRKHVVKTSEHIAKIALAHRGKTLSPEHRHILSTVRSQKSLALGRTTERICAYDLCQKPFTTIKLSRKTRFCSQACGYANRRGARAPNWSDIPIVICAVCAKPFRPTNNVQKRLCCSMSCKAIFQLLRQKNSGTNIERHMEQALIERAWFYESQVLLCKTTIVDFFLPLCQTAIYCDGDYWHSRPGKAEHDQRKTTILLAAGYAVYRFLGSAILLDVQACLDTIPYHSVPRNADI